MQEQNYLPVNWADGMKINKTHFLAQENAFIQQMAQSTAAVLTDNSYGLLPPLRGGSSVKLFLSIDNQQQVRLRIQQCRAVTRGGYYLQADEDTATGDSNLTASVLHLSVPFAELKGKAASFLVVLTVNPFERMPYGLAGADEVPPRLPYTVPALNVSLLPVQHTAKNLIGLFQLPVGRLLVEEQKVLLDGNYIPPCSAISSHVDLLETHASLEQFYAKMELYALQIIQKILQKKQANEMADIVRKLCENITLLTASHLAEIKAISLHEAPVYLLTKPVVMARLFKNILDYYIGSGKEEFINYCTEWCDVSQGELEGSITELANHQYDHLNIDAGIQKLIRFTKVVSQLFGALSRLEYIGKRRDAGIFVKEQAVNSESETPVRKRGSFLAD